jgi:DNA-binding NarL/FixJ family response regulator
MNPARVTIRVAVQSPRRLLRDTLAMCLGTRTDVTVVGKVAKPEELLALCELARPDTVILDAEPQPHEFAVSADSLLGHLRELLVRTGLTSLMAAGAS